jgi:hypothetical protein
MTHSKSPRQGKYAGIGSRQTPHEVLNIMHRIGAFLSNKNFVLRSGGASGADASFEQGCDSVNGTKEIYLPWQRFNNNKSPHFVVTPEAEKLAASVHPAWHTLSRPAKQLHGRNCYQILGLSLADPVDIVICWTPGGQATGGTATAIKLAVKHGIPVYNLAIARDKDSLREYFKKIKLA